MVESGGGGLYLALLLRVCPCCRGVLEAGILELLLGRQEEPGGETSEMGVLLRSGSQAADCHPALRCPPLPVQPPTFRAHGDGSLASQ